MRKILMVAGTLDRGGVESFLLTLAQNGLEFDICIEIPDKGALEDEFIKLGCKIYHLTRRSKSMIKHHKEFYNIVKNYEIVHINTQDAFLSYLEVKTAKKAGVKTIVVQSHNTSDWRKINIFHKLYRNKLRKNCIPCTCSKIAGQYLFNSDDITIVPQPLSTKKFKFNEAIRGHQRYNLDIDEGMIVLLHVGNFRKQKNHPFMINLIKELEGKYPGRFMLFFAGDGEYFDIIRESAIGLPVMFFGSVSHVEELMSAADAFILPSLHEGNPVTAIEAQANGLPCFFSDVITHEANLTGNVNFLPLDINTWLESLSKLRNNDLNLLNKREMYADVVYESCSPKATIKKLKKLYGIEN